MICDDRENPESTHERMHMRATYAKTGRDPKSTYERMHIHAAYTMTGRDPESTYERMHMRAAYAMTGRDPESPQAAANPMPGADQKRRHDVALTVGI